MIISRVAHRYAGAIFEAISEEDRAAFMADVYDLQQSLAKSRELTLFFESPILERSKKAAVIEELCKGRFGEQMRRVLLLLVSKEREALIAEVLESLSGLYRVAQGIQSVEVSTAIDLPQEIREELRSGLERYAKSKVDIDYAVDTELLGGVVVRIGDTVYDGSIQRQLSRLRRKFMTA